MNKVRLIDVDSKIPNLALMKLSAYHKGCGDDVDFYSPLMDADADIVYASKVFFSTPDYNYIPDGTIKGGIGYDIDSRLPNEVESYCPDYLLYRCDYAIGFTSRGCIRNCPFCIVRPKEGGFSITGDIYNFWRGQKRIMLLDNNLTANGNHFRKIINQIIDNHIQVDFNQGLDIRLITPWMARLLSQVRLWKQIHFSFDDVSLERYVRKGIDILITNGVKKYKLMFYVLIGFNSSPAEDIYRIKLLKELGIDPFVMPYDKTDSYQKRLARWVNHKAIFNTVEWNDYAGKYPK